MHVSTRILSTLGMLQTSRSKYLHIKRSMLTLSFLKPLDAYKAIPFFFLPLLSNAFSEFGSVGRKKKKKTQK